MDPLRITGGAAFGPDVLKVLSAAFDDAWADVSHNFYKHEQERGREFLAQAMMSMIRDNSTDGAMLRDAGIRALKKAYPMRFLDEARQSAQVREDSRSSEVARLADFERR